MIKHRERKEGGEGRVRGGKVDEEKRRKRRIEGATIDKEAGQ